MRKTTCVLLLTAVTGTAMAHTGEGPVLAALSHQIIGSHHLPFSILLIAVAILAIHRWHSSKRTN
jgi:hypothetical protein